jgi:hypothetical protein
MSTMADEPLSESCEVCGCEATVIVTVPTGAGLVVGPMCDQHAADVDAYASKVEVL